METTKIFIASSKKHVDIANAVKKNLENDKREIDVWDERTFDLGDTTLASLIEEGNNKDFAIFIFAPDDKININNNELYIVRDNVLFEYGMFVGCLGKHRCFAIIPNNEDVRIPSDLNGITFGKYKYDKSNNFNYYVSETKTSCREISEIINKIGPKYKQEYKPDDVIDFIGIQEKKKVGIFYHCEEVSKYAYWNVDPTPQTLLHALESNTKDCYYELNKTTECELDKLYEDVVKYDTIFIVDSPPYNTLCEDILKHCKTYLTGISIDASFKKDEETGQLVSHSIKLNSEINKEFDSDKQSAPNGKNAFGNFYDHFVIMRLPSIPTISVNKPSKLSLIWVIYGLHTKGTHAGLSLFIKEQIENLIKDTTFNYYYQKYEYFEMIFNVPKEPNIVDQYKQVNCVHKSIVRPKSFLALQDPTPSGMALYINKHIENIPLQTVHLDICSGCNYKCPSCIEKTSRENNKILTLKKIINILCALKRAGCNNVNFYGGEPTLHPDFPSINNFVQAMGFQSLLVTNGSQLDKKDIIDTILHSEKLHVRISIDGHSDMSHKRNHGLIKSELSPIQNATKNLISMIENKNKHISVSISFLLHKNVFMNNELFNAVKYWQENGAVSFHLRPVYNSKNKPIVNHIWENLYHIKDLLNTHPNFVFTPDWLKQAINQWSPTEKPTLPSQKKKYKKCYSSLYRFVISPSLDGLIIKKINITTNQGNLELGYTDDAYISMCSYQRYEHGCKYPEDFETWLAIDRIDLFNKITPSESKSFCNNIICCRHEPNMQVYHDIQKLKY